VAESRQGENSQEASRPQFDVEQAELVTEGSAGILLAFLPNDSYDLNEVWSR
jgi:hypothetical protein